MLLDCAYPVYLTKGRVEREGARVNHCCALHDNCYDLQLGRENCDQNFCDCLKRATAPDTCAATELKCLAIKKVGQQAYFDAASYEGESFMLL
ncbi:unnamed protein product [Haemonchus placei]|uniref:Phospholipase A2 n=1 Tax=Haemonchus placei TaxID=6290 RepID=A0A0N4WMH7_HAEPC|nr:unnamed protein product [Haemonchus placei]